MSGLRRWWCRHRWHPHPRLRLLDPTLDEGCALAWCPDCRQDLLIKIEGNEET